MRDGSNVRIRKNRESVTIGVLNIVENGIRTEPLFLYGAKELGEVAYGVSQK